MLKKLLAASVFFILASTLARPEVAFACSCAVTDFDEAVKNAEVLFYGKVTSTTDVATSGVASDKSFAAFDVERVWKGEVGGSVSVSTPGNSAACGYNFEKSSSYVVFGTFEADGTVNTTLCSATYQTNLDQAIERLGKDHIPDDEESAPNENPIPTNDQPGAKTSSFPTTNVIAVVAGVILGILVSMAVRRRS